MAPLTKNAISVTVRDRAKRMKIWDHKGYKSKIRNISKIQNFIKKNWNGRLERNFLSWIQLEIEQNGRKFGVIRVIIWKSTILWKFYNFSKFGIQSKIAMGMRWFCAQAQKQVDKSEIYLAISSFFWSISVTTGCNIFKLGFNIVYTE